jgi:FKBP-type peptidyl-prolyl cis-trans isomerase
VLWRRVAGDGTGAHPAIADTVTVHYSGTLVDGTEFDSSYGGNPVSFPLRGLIRAWQEAIPQAGVGDTIEIAVPSNLGYGPKGAGPIPGGATLLFKIELLGIES